MNRISFLGITILIGLICGSKLLAVTITNQSARIPRGEATQIDLRFNMRAVSPSDVQTVGANEVTTSSVQNLIVALLDICINPEANICRGPGNRKAEYQGQRDLDQTPEADFDDLNVITIPPNGIRLLRDPDVAGRYDAEVHLVIRPKTAQVTYDAETRIVLSYPVGQQQDIPMTVSVSSIAITEPTGLSIRAGNRSLTVSWDALDQVNFATGSPGPSLGMNVYLVPVSPENNGYTLQGVMARYNSNVEEENEFFSCVLEVQSFENRVCTFTCDNPSQGHAYIRPNLVRDLAPEIPFDIRSAPASRNSLTFAGLVDTDQFYAAFIQPLPDGARARNNNSCVMASPIQTFSYAEITGGDESTLADPQCFIATAAYGSSLDPRLDDLRWFRDHVIRRAPLGELIIEHYYRLSPPMAQWIENKPVAARLVRLVLAGPVRVISFLRQEMD